MSNGARVTSILLTLFGQGTALCDPYEQEINGVVAQRWKGFVSFYYT